MMNEDLMAGVKSLTGATLELTGFPLGPSSPGGPRIPGGPAAPGGPVSPFSPTSPFSPCEAAQLRRLHAYPERQRRT